MDQLIKALLANFPDVISLMAPDVFFNKDGSQNLKNIEEFQNRTGATVFITSGKVLTKTSGYILYKGYKYTFA